MRRLRSAIGILGLGLICAAVGCGLARKARRAESGDASHNPSRMPPNTILLSAMLRELSQHPGFTEKFLAEVQGSTGTPGRRKAGAALLTPELVTRLREMILGKDWEGLDRFPGWTMRQINPTVRVVGHLAGKDQKVEDLATAGGAPSGEPGPQPTAAESRTATLKYIDLGPYNLNRAETVSLDQPADGKGFDPSAYLTALGEGVTRGDGPDPARAPRHAESERLANLLNRLSMNGATAKGGEAVARADVGGTQATSPQDLIAALIASGHQVTVADSRYFANFGHLHFKGQDVMMPFWINSQIIVPGTSRPLLVPVSHAEYEWFISGPKINAEVSFYFGIDGKAEFRTMDQLDQTWVMNRHAHEYRGADAVEVTRLAGALVQTYAHLHATRPRLPFGGYYALGVCQDVVAAIELKMTGQATLFPNTADATLFNDPRDAEINRLIDRIPKDRAGRPPEVPRVFASLPVGDSDAELASVSIPGLGADLVAVHDAWNLGDLRRIRPRAEVWGSRAAAGLGIVIACAVAWWLRRRTSR